MLMYSVGRFKRDDLLCKSIAEFQLLCNLVHSVNYSPTAFKFHLPMNSISFSCRVNPTMFLLQRSNKPPTPSLLDRQNVKAVGYTEQQEHGR